MKSVTVAPRVRRALVSLTLVASLVMASTFSSGCFTQRVRVGTGANGGEKMEHRQWFALWGLIPITEIDPEGSLNGATNYDVVSTFTPVDVIVGIVTGIVTVQPKTIIIEK